MRKIDRKAEKRIEEAIHSVELELGKCSEEEIELIKKSAYGEISHDEFTEQVLILAHQK